MSNRNGGATSGGGPGGYSWWVWIGGGCAVILVIFGILFAFGAYKGITCCTEAIQQHQQVQTFSVEFAQRIRDGDDQWAYDQLTESYKSRTTPQEFADELATYREAMKGAVPQPIGTHRQYESAGDGKSGNYWRVTVAYLPSEGDRILLMQGRFVPNKSGEEMTIRVGGLKFDRRRRSDVDDPASKLVRQFVSAVPKSDRKAVNGMLGGGPDAGGASAWQVVDSSPNVFETTNFDITGVRYHVGGEATVDARHVLDGGETRRVRYHLRRSNLRWRLTDIELDVGPPPGGRAPEGGAPDGGTDAGSPGDAGTADTADGG